jgi:hypothetical protein
MTNTIDRLIDWCECNGLAIDVNFMTGKIKINGNKHKFDNQDAAIAWAANFAKNWGMKAP